MLNALTVTTILLAFADNAPDYVSQRKAAKALVQAGNQEEALAAFIELADGAASDVQKSDALEQAALCASGLTQYDRAIELAQQIPLAPISKTCQMQILSSARKWPEIVEKFHGEDIDSWPDGVKGEAFFVRGDAHYLTKNGAAAEKDYRQAAEYLTNANSLGLCLNQLGDTYRDLLKDDERAIAAYRKTFTAGTIYKQCQAAINVAGILEQHKKPAEAVDELQRIDLEQVTAPFWRGALLRARGQALAAAGKKSQSIASYKEALQIEDLPAGIEAECEKALKELQAGEKGGISGR